MNLVDNDNLDEYWMQQALLQAEQALQVNEVPVGAVVVMENRIIGQGYNQPISGNDPTAHAEIMALRDAASNMSNYRLPQATLYVTIEPCTMCAGALIHARIKEVVFGAREPRAGVLCSQLNIPEQAFYNHQLIVREGVLSLECGDLVRNFFSNKRQ